MIRANHVGRVYRACRANSCTAMGRLLTIRESAERLGLREGTVRFWVSRRRLPKVKLGRAVRIPEEALDALIRSGYVPARRSLGADPGIRAPLAPSVRSER